MKSARELIQERVKKDSTSKPIKEDYQGWRNWETWNCALHIDSVRMHEEATRIVDENNGDRKASVSDMASVVESYIEEQKPDLDGFFGDVVGMAMGEVHWTEIAEKYVDAAISEREPEEEEPEEEPGE